MGYILCAVCVVLLGCVTQAWVIYSVQCAWYCVGCVSKRGLYTLCSVRGTVRLRDSSVGYILRAVCMVLCRLCEASVGCTLCSVHGTVRYQPAHIGTNLHT